MIKKAKFPNIYAESEAERCLLCNDAPCSRACKIMNVASAIRSFRFKNAIGAAAKIHLDGCEKCETQNCIKVCNRAKVDKPIDIPALINYLKGSQMDAKLKIENLPDLSVNFCGIRCENPFVLASSVITSSYDMCKRALEAGWGGVAIKTISYIEIKEVSPRFDIHSPNQYPFIGFKNLEQLSPNDPVFDFAWVKKLKEEFPSKLIIASIMGSDKNEWATLSKMAQDAKADIIECNFSCPQMVGENLGSDVGQNSALVGAYTKACCSVVNIPVIAKLTPNVSSPDDFVKAALEGGAVGIAGINTIKCITTVDFSGDSAPFGIQNKSAVSGYSGKAVKPIALRFIRDTHISIFHNANDDSQFNISGIGGIETWRDALDFILLGCANIQVCTAVMQYGYRIIDDLLQGLRIYMKENNYSKLDYIVARDLFNIREPENLNRDTINYPTFEHDKCMGCGRCYVSCSDGGHQAIRMDGGKPYLNKAKCVGCHLCKFVCITSAIK